MTAETQRAQQSLANLPYDTIVFDIEESTFIYWTIIEHIVYDDRYTIHSASVDHHYDYDDLFSFTAVEFMKEMYMADITIAELLW